MIAGRVTPHKLVSFNNKIQSGTRFATQSHENPNSSHGCHVSHHYPKVQRPRQTGNRITAPYTSVCFVFFKPLTQPSVENLLRTCKSQQKFIAAASILAGNSAKTHKHTLRKSNLKVSRPLT